MKRATLTLLSILSITLIHAQPLCSITAFDEEDGLPHSHVTQLLQDDCGFMWFATWNGLCRYDGYEFRTFKPAVGDGCHMLTDRIRDCALRQDGQIIVRTDDEYFRFDTHTYRFYDITGDEATQAADDIRKNRKSFSMKGHPVLWTDSYGTEWTLTDDGQLSFRQQGAAAATHYASLPMRNATFACNDRQGNLWCLASDKVYRLCTSVQRSRRLSIEPQGEVKCIFRDSKGRMWTATKEDQTVRIWTGDGQSLIGYLAADGTVRTSYTRFGAAVYCIFQQVDGTLWLGSKPDGIFRLRETRPGTFSISRLTKLPNTAVYNITEDSYGRLWVATLGGGLCYTRQPQADDPEFSVPKNFPKDVASRVRFLHITRQGILLATTTEGLLAARLEADADKMVFRLHQREADRGSSLSSSATMDIAEDDSGGILISTESGGINYAKAAELLSEKPVFRHNDDANRQQASDVVLSLTRMGGGRLMAVGNTRISIIGPQGDYRILDNHFFNDKFHFSDAHPQQLADGGWLIGLSNGAIVTSEQQMNHAGYSPRLVLTGVSIQGGSSNWAVEAADTLVLKPDERNLTISFAAIDYNAAERISYAFRLVDESSSDSVHWNYVSHNRSASLLDMEPGSYRIEIRSTNADGQWTDNTRTLTIIVTPTFWESALGRLLLLLIILSTAGAIVYTLLYIRRIKRQQHETLEKYLALIELSNRQTEATASEAAPDGLMGNQPANGNAASGNSADSIAANEDMAVASYDPGNTKSATEKPEEALDPMLKRVMDFINKNISNSEINVGDMAAAAATSRSGLQRKLKHTMGITPLDLLREARIKHACRLLTESNKNVSEIAYESGFSDPKYFSRCFKQSTGMSPSEYKK